MTVFYSVKIAGRQRKTRFVGSKKTVYKKLHRQGYRYERLGREWIMVQELHLEPEQKRPEQPEETEPEQNVMLLISIGDYKHAEFDIIIKRIFTAQDFRNLVERSDTVEESHMRIRNETIDMAIAKLRENGHFGLASMMKHNSNIDYVLGGEYTWTSEAAQDVEFTRFLIRGTDALKQINSKRAVPLNYNKRQSKINEDNVE